MIRLAPKVRWMFFEWNMIKERKVLSLYFKSNKIDKLLDHSSECITVTEHMEIQIKWQPIENISY